MLKLKRESAARLTQEGMRLSSIVWSIVLPIARFESHDGCIANTSADDERV